MAFGRGWFVGGEAHQLLVGLVRERMISKQQRVLIVCSYLTVKMLCQIGLKCATIFPNKNQNRAGEGEEDQQTATGAHRLLLFRQKLFRKLSNFVSNRKNLNKAG